MGQKTSSEQSQASQSSNYKIRRYLKLYKLGGLAVTSFMLYWVTVSPARSIQTLRYASTGPDVKKIQERLVSAGFLENHQIDGVFGTQTKAAVREFQRSQGLSPDGVLGSQTYEVLERQPFFAQSFGSSTLPLKTVIPVGLIVVVVTVVMVAAAAGKPDFDSTSILEGNVLNVTLTWRGYKFYKLKAYIDEKQADIDDKPEKVLTEEEKRDRKAKFTIATTPESSELKLECFQEDGNDPVIHTSPIIR
jgi:Putative peptidoglycan binding domain